jgi:cysteine desulfurase / selenocysteine lyase
MPILDIDRIRASFPHLAECTYLNTAGVGLSWRGQGAAAAEFYDIAKSKGIGGSAAWTARGEATQGQLATLLGVPAAAVQFAASTTEALNLIALGLPLGVGDRVVVAADEFPSLIQPWLTRHKAGVRLTRVAVPSERDRTHALASAVQTGVRALAVSHVHWRTGTRVDLSLLGSVCRAHDCRLIVDGIQGIGAVPADASGVDAYCASVFKWLLGGFGLGFLALSEQFERELTPPLRGYANEFPSHLLRYGHVNYPGIYALNATLDYLASIGWQNIHERVGHLIRRLSDSLRAFDFDVVTPEGANAGIVSVRHPRAALLVRTLAEQSIVVENGDPFVRISPHFYNTDAEIDLCVAALCAARDAKPI